MGKPTSSGGSYNNKAGFEAAIRSATNSLILLVSSRSRKGDDNTMERTRFYLLIGTGVALLACSLVIGALSSTHAGGGPDVCINRACNTVRVASDAGNPIVVREADSLENHAFQATATVTLDQGFLGQNGFVTVPQGKRLVIEYASARAFIPAGQNLVFSIDTNLNGENVSEFHHLPATQQFTSGNTTEFITGEQVRIYADAGFLILRADRDSANGTGTFIFTVSGHLIDMQ
jgi:hypothetical protein